MAVKRRYIECECGELFEEERGVLQGGTSLGPWNIRESRKRTTKTAEDGEILVAVFERGVFCAKCTKELMREKKQYEVTPPVAATDSPVTSYYSRDFIWQAKDLQEKPEPS